MLSHRLLACALAVFLTSSVTLWSQEVKRLDPSSHGAKITMAGDRPDIGAHFTTEFRYLFETSEEFDQAYGLELRYQNWVSDYLGFGLGLGFESWDGEPVVELENGEVGSVDLDVVPIGASLLLSPGPTGPVLIGADAGLYYAYVDGDVDVENAVYGRLGLNMDVGLGGPAGLFLGVGYQIDVVKPEIQRSGVDLSLEGFYGRLGVRFNF